MKAFNTSGVMVVKDGKVLLERYGPRPQTRGSHGSPFR
jgi:hypothetical protein